MTDMEIRRATLAVAIRLAFAISAIAAMVAVGLEMVGDVSRPALVACVTVVGFVASWVQTGRTADAIRRDRRGLIAIPLERHSR